jgi:hypothetical protein
MMFAHDSDATPMSTAAVKQEDNEVMLRMKRQVIGSTEASSMEDESQPHKKQVVRREMGMVGVGVASGEEHTLPVGNIKGGTAGRGRSPKHWKLWGRTRTWSWKQQRRRQGRN